MLWAILKKSWRQHPTKQQLYSHLPPIMKIIKVRQTKHAGHCWRSRDELISDVLLWTPAHGWAKAGQLARTYIQQFCEDTGYSPEDLPEAMNDREEWQERVSDIRAGGMTWWWWYNQNTIERWTKGCFLPFSKKGNLKNTKNQRSITFTSKFYNALLLNYIESEIEKILRKKSERLAE